LAAASPAFASLAPGAVIAYAPQPGARRFFGAAELTRLARANHLAVAGLSSVCFERAVAPLDPDAVRDAMLKSFGAAGTRIEILELSKFPAPKGNIVFPRASLARMFSSDTAVWNGYVEYDKSHFPIWAQVRLTVHETRIVAAGDLKPGRAVRQGDVRVEEADEFPRGPAPLSSLDAVVGRIPRRVIPAGSPVTATELAEPNDVERGQTVVVEVHSGTAVLKLEAQAEGAGHRGDLVPVRNAASGKIFRARIKDRGLVLVECRSVPERSL
jgi:flagella basal body P-ring formation protein FlgA